MSPIPAAITRKIISPEASEELSWLRPLVFTNGVFDVLHCGHVAYLAAARELGLTLLVGVNTDRSVRQLAKGPHRPWNTERDRLVVLAALESVSAVVMFDEQTPCELIRCWKPDVYVKGGDYDMELLEETKLVRSWGGKSIAIPFVGGYSTTTLIERIRRTA